MKLLLLEDDPFLGELLYEHLSQDFNVCFCYDGLMAYDEIIQNNFDILLLDVSVPSLSGFELLQALRDREISTPTMFITSLNSAVDLKRGFDIGCNEYLKKPFEFIELDARLQNLIKNHKLADKTYRLDDFHIDIAMQNVTNGATSYKLSHKESKIIEYFLKNRTKVITADELASNVWNYEETPNNTTIRTYIKNLRAIFGKDKIQSIKGVGYVLL
jgi:two-component system OmpR family response regulator